MRMALCSELVTTSVRRPRLSAPDTTTFAPSVSPNTAAGLPTDLGNAFTSCR